MGMLHCTANWDEECQTFSQRQVFLDHDPDPQAMAAALREAIEQSKAAPTVAIGHPSRALAAVLEAGLDEAYADGVAVFPLSEHIARTQSAKSTDSEPNGAGSSAP